MRVHACVCVCVCLCVRAAALPRVQEKLFSMLTAHLSAEVSSARHKFLPSVVGCVILTSSGMRICVHAVLLELVLSSGSLGQACEDCPAVPVLVPQPTLWARAVSSLRLLRVEHN